MKLGDLVRLDLHSNLTFHWEDRTKDERGFWLYDSTKRLMKNGAGDFKARDLCLVVGIDGNLVEVMTPRSQIGYINMVYIEAVQGSDGVG